jgi:hypothetical protein
MKMVEPGIVVIACRRSFKICIVLSPCLSIQFELILRLVFVSRCPDYLTRSRLSEMVFSKAAYTGGKMSGLIFSLLN